MKLTLERVTEYRYLLINKKNEPIAVFHIGDLWNTEDEELTNKLKSRSTKRLPVELKLYNQEE